MPGGDLCGGMKKPPGSVTSSMKVHSSELQGSTEQASAP
jgi:hypothetical protein